MKNHNPMFPEEEQGGGIPHAMEMVVDNAKEMLIPLLNKHDYVLDFFRADDKILVKQLVSKHKEWSSFAKRLLGESGSGYCKLFHNRSPKDYRVIQIFHKFDSIKKMLYRRYPQINIPSDVTSKYPSGSPDVRKSVRSFYDQLRGFLFLCNTDDLFLFGRYVDIIDDMTFTYRTDPGNLNRLFIPSFINIGLHPVNEEGFFNWLLEIFEK